MIECKVVGGWKGWKKITIYWKIWGKWLENHIQIAEFWLEFFLMVCGNPVIVASGNYRGNMGKELMGKNMGK